MKLIRLTSNDRTGYFDNRFDTDINIKEDSQIALRSCSFKTVISTLAVKNTNQDISFQIKVGEVKTIKLDTAIYTAANQDVLFKQITDKLNKTLSVVDRQIGLQFLAQVGSTTSKVEIGYKKASLTNVKDGLAATVFAKSASVLTTSDKVRQTGDNVTTDENRLYSKVPLGQGCAVFRAKILSLTADGAADNKNGFTMGLSSTDPDTWDSVNLTEAEKDYYIKMVRFGTNYQEKTPTSPVADSGVALGNVGQAPGDFIEFAIELGKVKCRIYKDADATPEVLFSEDYVVGTNYFPFITFQGNNNRTSLRLVAWTMDPYQIPVAPALQTTELAFFEAVGDSLNATPPKTTMPGAGATNILTLHEDLRSFFGYSFSVNEQTSNNPNFVAEKNFLATLINDSFYIEMRNIELESYDGASGTRKNILSTIPKSDNELLVEYEPNNLNFVDIKNIRSAIRNIQCRILRIDDEEPLISGLAVITVFIKEKNE
tara:strand:+ start:75 stop:1532 length:1458 start_codon:yes stop_codon:yes gene_type:complete